MKGTILERESHAYAHPEYIKIIDGIKAAIEIEEKLKWQFESALAHIEIWRTEQANNRAVDRAHT